MIATLSLSEKVKNDLSLHMTGGNAWAIYIGDLMKMLNEAGFNKIKIQLNEGSGNDCAKWTNLEDVVASAMIAAEKPNII